MSKQAHLADGTVLDFPDDTPDDVMDRVVKQHVQPAAAPADDRTWQQVAGGQFKNVVKGAVGAITGIPGAIADIVGGRGSLSGMAHGIADPVTTTLQGAGALIAPDSMPAPSNQDWQKAAQGAGGIAAGLALPELVGKAVVLSPEAETLQTLANKARNIRAGSSISDINILKPISMVKPIAGAAASAVAPVLEKLAQLRAARDIAPAASAAAAPVSQLIEMPGGPQISADIARDQAPQFDIRRTSGSPQPIEMPGGPQISADIARDQAPQFDIRRTSGSPQPIEMPGGPQLSADIARDQAPQFDMRQPGHTSPSEIWIPHEILDPLKAQMTYENTPQLDMRQPSGPSGPSQPIEMPNAPDMRVAPQAPTEVDPTIHNEQQLLGGPKAATTEQAALAEKVAPKLAAKNPEMAKLQGLRYDQQTFQNFKVAEANLKALEDTRNPNSTIPKQEIIKGLEKSVDTLQVPGEPITAKDGTVTVPKISAHPAAVKVLTDAINTIDQFPEQIPSADALKFRRGLDKAIQNSGGWKETSSAADRATMLAQREVAGLFRDQLSKTASPELKAAYDDYGRSADAMTASGLSWETGRRVIGELTDAQKLAEKAKQVRSK